MAFQEFALISQRRHQLREQTTVQWLTIAAVCLFAIALVAGAIFAVITYNNSQNMKEEVPASKASNPSSPKSSINMAVKAVCATTDYKKTCLASLAKAMKPESQNPANDLLKSVFSVASTAIQKSVQQAKAHKFKNKAAFQDCADLLNAARDELNASVSIIKSEGTANLSSIKPDLNSWLSAVVSYQQTCIDGFPDGEDKKAMEKFLKTSKMHTSNALAIVSQASSLLPKLKAAASSQRRLLAVDDAGLLTWLNHDDRRMLKTDPTKYTPNVTVAKDGSGKFSTINDALEAMPKNYKGRYVIFVKEGVYEETVSITRSMENLTIYGEGSQKSIITGSHNFADGVTVLQTAPFVVLGDNFIAQSLGFRNTAGADRKQAVALRVQGDRAMFINCRMEGYQSTVFAQVHRQFYRSCYITGTVDIIFGDAAAVFQNCMVHIRKGIKGEANTVTAQGRVDKRETTGFVLHNSRILPEKELESAETKFKSYLGRPGKAYARVVVMESEISDVIQPEGWVAGTSDYSKTVSIGEFKNEGGRGGTSGRVKWEGYNGSMNKNKAMQFTVGPFLQGESWIKGANVPVRFGLFH